MGFSLDASVRIEGQDRAGLERLLHHCARPTLRASRLYAMVRERGYPGGPDHFRALVARLRPRPAAKAYLRLHTLPGEQGQADWAHFGKLSVGRAGSVR